MLKQREYLFGSATIAEHIPVSSLSLALPVYVKLETQTPNIFVHLKHFTKRQTFRTQQFEIHIRNGDTLCLLSCICICSRSYEVPTKMCYF